MIEIMNWEHGEKTVCLGGISKGESFVFEDEHPESGGVWVKSDVNFIFDVSTGKMAHINFNDDFISDFHWTTQVHLVYGYLDIVSDE